VSRSGPVLETARLILRVPAEEDFDAFAAMQDDAEHVRFVGGRQDRAGAWRTWCAIAGAWMIRGFSMFSVIEKSSGQWVGRVGPWQPEGWPGREVGWGIAPWATRKGYAVEAACACLDYAFDELGWPDVIHVIDPDNTGSLAVARALGSRNLGPCQMPAPMHTLRVDAWGQSASDWAERRRGD
jgi:RimJ/RimL family protein N-acetyltransferase